MAAATSGTSDVTKSGGGGGPNSASLACAYNYYCCAEESESLEGLKQLAVGWCRRRSFHLQARLLAPRSKSQ